MAADFTIGFLQLLGCGEETGVVISNAKFHTIHLKLEKELYPSSRSNFRADRIDSESTFPSDASECYPVLV